MKLLVTDMRIRKLQSNPNKKSGKICCGQKACYRTRLARGVRGYRAPSFSIGRENLWMHDLLTETGHDYSSSIYPVKHDHYGMPEAPRFAHYSSSGLLEIPLTTTRLLGRNFPAAGGGYFRLLPYPVSKAMIDRVNRKEHRAAIFYCHPWEIDTAQPRIQKASAKSQFRHYINLKTHGESAKSPAS